MIIAYYFTADWCAPCKKVRPIVEEINKDSIVKFKIIDNPEGYAKMMSFMISIVDERNKLIENKAKGKDY